MYETYPYIAEKLQAHERERHKRIASEAPALEQGARLALRGVRVLLRGTGHGMVAGGRLLLDLTQSAADTAPTNNAHPAMRYSTNK